MGGGKAVTGGGHRLPEPNLPYTLFPKNCVTQRLLGKRLRAGVWEDGFQSEYPTFSPYTSVDNK